MSNSARSGKNTKTAKRKRSNTFASGLNAGIVAVDSCYDLSTDAVFEYRVNNVYPRLEKNGFDIKYCNGNLAARHYVSAALKQPRVRFLTGSGHGQATQFLGSYNSIIFEIGKYAAAEVKNKIIHLCACYSALELGADLVEKGCKAFLGYDEEFSFSRKYADIFLKCDAEIDIAIAEGDTVSQAYIRAIQLYNKYIKEFDAKGLTMEVALLRYNRNHLCAPDRDARWGDPSAKLRNVKP